MRRDCLGIVLIVSEIVIIITAAALLWAACHSY
jgi:hypothetical protein